MSKPMMQRGRPSKRSTLEIILERGFLAAFRKRGIPVNKTATHFFGWVVYEVEHSKDEDIRRERLISDFESNCEAEGIPKTWKNALAWYVRKG